MNCGRCFWQSMATRKQLIKAVADRLYREVNELDPGGVLRLAEAYAKLAGQGSAVDAGQGRDARRIVVSFQGDADDLAR